MRGSRRFPLAVSCLLLLVAGLVHLVPANVSADANETAVSSPNAASAASIRLGVEYSCALMASGTVKCWGLNDEGQLGDGTTTNRLTPVDVVGLSSGVGPTPTTTTQPGSGNSSSNIASPALPLVTMPVEITTTTPSTTSTTEAPATTEVPTTTVPTPVAGADGELPNPEIGEGMVFEGGEPVPSEITVADDTLTIASTTFEINLTPECDTNCARLEGPSGESTVVAESGNTAQVTGFGFKPGTQVDVWLFSEATYLGSLTVQADGTFAGDVPVPYLPAGEHTLQTNGLTTDDKIRSANAAIGVASEAAPTPTDGELPSTGSTTRSSLIVVMMLLAVGLAVMGTARRADPGRRPSQP